MANPNLKRKLPTKSRKTKKAKKSGKIRLKKPSKFRIRHKRRVFNVKADHDMFLYTNKKKWRSRKEKKAIARRFKQGYSPFSDSITDVLQITSSTDTDKCRWIWRGENHTDYIKILFNRFPTDERGAGQNAPSDVNNYSNSGTQTIYISRFTYEYEIMNPTNYDMYLNIYDIVCKRDTDRKSRNAYYINDSTSSYLASETNANPIALINHGLYQKTGYNQSADASETLFVSLPSDKTMGDISLNPTESYPFNMYFKIVRKYTLKLEPGATITHKFTFNPRKMFNRGSFFYQYNYAFGQSDNYRDLALAGVTCGCLFKFWGQISGSATVTPTPKYTEVASLPGKLMIKELFKCKWYALDEKSIYNFRSTKNSYTPPEVSNMEVINDVGPRRINEVNLTNADNVLP